jgi:hypothetical protein
MPVMKLVLPVLAAMGLALQASPAHADPIEVPEPPYCVVITQLWVGGEPVTPIIEACGPDLPPWLFPIIITPPPIDPPP